MVPLPFFSQPYWETQVNGDTAYKLSSGTSKELIIPEVSVENTISRPSPPHSPPLRWGRESSGGQYSRGVSCECAANCA
jgi:hypothetical protein